MTKARNSFSPTPFYCQIRAAKFEKPCLQRTFGLIKSREKTGHLSDSTQNSQLRVLFSFVPLNSLPTFNDGHFR